MASRALSPALPAAVLCLSLLASTARADGGTRPSDPSPVPSSPSAPSARPEQSPEEKALADRREAEALYAGAWKEVEKARAELAEAEALASDPGKAGKKTGSAQKRLRKSLDRFLEATRLAPEYAEAWNMLGYCYRLTGDTQNAFKAYWESLRLKPDYAPAREYLGEAYLMADNLPKAREQLAWLEEHDREQAAILARKIEEYVARRPPAPPPTD